MQTESMTVDEVLQKQSHASSSSDMNTHVNSCTSEEQTEQIDSSEDQFAPIVMNPEVPCNPSVEET